MDMRIIVDHPLLGELILGETVLEFWDDETKQMYTEVLYGIDTRTEYNFIGENEQYNMARRPLERDITIEDLEQYDEIEDIE